MHDKTYLPPTPNLPVGAPQFYLLPASSPNGQRLLAGDGFVYNTYWLDHWVRASGTPEGAICNCARVWGDRLLVAGAIDSEPWQREPGGPTLYDVRYTRIVAYLLPDNHAETTVNNLLAEYRRLIAESAGSVSP